MTVVAAGVSPLISLQFVAITSWSQAGPARSNASHLLTQQELSLSRGWQLLGQLHGELEVSVHVLHGLSLTLLLHVLSRSLPLNTFSLLTLLSLPFFTLSTFSLRSLLVESVTFTLFLFSSLLVWVQNVYSF